MQKLGDLLTFSRVSKTKVSETNVNIAIDEALSLVEAQAKVKSIQIIKNMAMICSRLLQIRIKYNR